MFLGKAYLKKIYMIHPGIVLTLLKPCGHITIFTLLNKETLYRIKYSYCHLLKKQQLLKS